MYPSLPVVDEDERHRMRPVGRSVERYAKAIDGLVDIVKGADELGYWGMSFIEHHLHSEGFEVGPCPGIMNAWLGPYAKRMRLGQLGYVMSAQHPLRVAEEAAVLDHILKGRFFVGFARGYQSRWVRTIGQHYDSAATLMERDTAAQAAADERNQKIFRELVDIVVKAWTETSFSYDGEFFKVPFPYDGIDDYPAFPCAEQFGARGEIDREHRVRQISVVPAPYQQPHPPVFVTSSGTPESARWAAKRGFNCGYFAPMEHAVAQNAAYLEGASETGRRIAPGQNQLLLRFGHVGKTREDALRKVERYIVPPFDNFYRYFFPRLFSSEASSTFERMMATGMVIAGTVDDVKRQVAAIYEQIPFEYFGIVSHYALEPKEEFLEDIDLFATKIACEFD